MKVCKGACQLEKETSEFGVSSSNKDGLNKTCKACERERGRLSYKFNSENRSKRLARNREYHKLNTAQVRARKNAYYAANPEAYQNILNYGRNYTETHKEQSTAHTAKRRATKLNQTPKWVGKEELLQISNLYKEASRLTKQTGILYHVDHIVPLQNLLVAGFHCLVNLQILPASENMSKGNRWWPSMPN
jgi:hypothetical protein